GVLPRLWAVVNLGDEDTRLVLIAVPLQGLAAHLAARHPGQALPTTVGDLVGSFLREFPDCPPIRLRLGPGEGFRLPSGGLILDADATDKQDPDVLLLLSEQPLAYPVTFLPRESPPGTGSATKAASRVGELVLRLGGAAKKKIPDPAVRLRRDEPYVSGAPPD